MFLGPQSLGKQQKEVRVGVENSGRTSQVWQTHLVACRDRRAWPCGTAGPEWTKGAAEDEPDNTKAEHKPKAAQPDVVDTNTEPSEGDGHLQGAQAGGAVEKDTGGRKDCPVTKGDLEQSGAGSAAEDEPDNTKAEHEPKAAQPEIVDTIAKPRERDGHPQGAQEGDPATEDGGGSTDRLPPRTQGLEP